MIFRTKPSQIAKSSKPQCRAYQTFTSMPRRSRDRPRLSRCYTFIALLVSLIVVACTQDIKTDLSPVNDSLTQRTVLRIWWDKGFTLEEDEALQQVVHHWEQQSGTKVKLSFYTNDELPQKAQRAIQASKLPDVMVSDSAHRELNPRLAWEGKLADVSDVIEPVKSLYPELVQAADFYNKVDKKRSYYVVPMHQETIHVFYWRDLLKLAGRSEKDIPKDWNGFWQFWKQVQHDLRAKQKRDIYGLGFTFSIGSSDTYYMFEQILEAYDVQILDSKGQLLVDDPQVRQGIIKCLDWYAQFYQQGYVPPEAVNWLNPDNNRSLLNRRVVMTPNATLSIPAAVRQDPDTYRNKLGTIEFPNKPNGKSMRYLVTVKEAVIFAESKNQKLAKDFLTYLIRPEVTGDYLKAVGGRNLPILKPVWKKPFWTDPIDPHISTAAKALTKGQTRPFYFVQNPAYSIVLEENIWGKALNRIVVDGISPEPAADEAMEQIKQIFNQWQ